MQQLAERQIQPQQEQQEDDTDAGYPLDQFGITDQVQPGRTEQPAKQDIGDQQGLPGIEGQGRHQGGPGENQKNGIDQRIRLRDLHEGSPDISNSRV